MINIDMPHRVSLAPLEVGLATAVGKARRKQCLEAGYKDKHGLKGSKKHKLKIECLGAAGEIVVAKAADVYYNPTVGTFQSGSDVHGWQVKTKLGSGGPMIIRPQDFQRHSDQPHFLVYRLHPDRYDFVIRGWIYPYEVADRDDLISDPEGRGAPCHCVPPTELYTLFTQ